MVLTPKQFKRRNPTAPPQAVAAYAWFYKEVGRSHNARQRSAARFVRAGGREIRQ